MPMLLSLESADWTLHVWCKDITVSQQQLFHTLKTRQQPLPSTTFRFHPELHLTDVDRQESNYIIDEKALFFENKLYEFDFQFTHCTGKPTIQHRLKRVEEAFHAVGKSLRGSINFGNDIGWFKLELCYQVANKIRTQAISFEVLPTKMDIATDLLAIQQTIDQHYPLLHFSFAQKTEQELARSNKPHERFPLLWLSQFESLREMLEKGIKTIIQQPHSRLLPVTNTCRAEQLKGHLGAKLEQRVGLALRSNRQQRYELKTKRLSVNTPENCFIKYVLERCSRDLSTFIKRAQQNNQVPDNQRLSSTFFAELISWKKPLERALKQPFFREVGRFEGLNRESLVLHQKAGYATVYRVWQQLKLYLDVFGKHAHISMKSIAELYEIWCVLEVRRILKEELGFSEIKGKKAVLYHKGLEKSLREGFSAAFYLRRGNLIIRLVHEPRFSLSKQQKSGSIYSWVTNQKPDILLEAELATGEKIRWIFDAKYRVAVDRDLQDLAPDDAINQMHRYRDALVHIHQANDGFQEKSRPIFGAFVLYPGWFNEEEMKNPYKEGIEAVGIGAFPLLPNSKNQWLCSFLREQFGTAYQASATDHYYVQEATRIAYTGMTLSRYKQLTLCVTLGAKRDKSYLDGFKEGQAQWYHIPVNTTITRKMQRAVIHEIKYCAFAVYDSVSKQHRIATAYAIRSIRLVKRSDITRQQAGASVAPKNTHKKYWLFELGTASTIKPTVVVTGMSDFKFKLIAFDELDKAKDWDSLMSYYAFFPT